MLSVLCTDILAVSLTLVLEGSLTQILASSLVFLFSIFASSRIHLCWPLSIFVTIVNKQWLISDDGYSIKF